MLLNLAVQNFAPEAPEKMHKWNMDYRGKCVASTVPILAAGALDTVLVIPALAWNILSLGNDEFLNAVGMSPLATFPAVARQLVLAVNPNFDWPHKDEINARGYVYNFTAKYFEQMANECAGADSKWSYHITSRVASVAAAAFAVISFAGDAVIAAVTLPLVLVRGGRDEKINTIAFSSLTFPVMALLVVHSAMQFIYPRDLQQD